MRIQGGIKNEILRFFCYSEESDRSTLISFQESFNKISIALITFLSVALGITYSQISSSQTNVSMVELFMTLSKFLMISIFFNVIIFGVFNLAVVFAKFNLLSNTKNISIPVFSIILFLFFGAALIIANVGLLKWVINNWDMFLVYVKCDMIGTSENVFIRDHYSSFFNEECKKVINQ